MLGPLRKRCPDKKLFSLQPRLKMGIVDASSRDKRCRVHTSDLRIYVEAAGFATFPDGAVICGPLQQHEPSPRATALNPTVLLEVTSDSSEEYDNTFKLECYRTIPTLSDYIIVSHRERRITVHSRYGSDEMDGQSGDRRR